MGNIKLLLLPILLAIGEARSSTIDMKAEDVRFAGSIDGKSFYAVTSDIKMSWTAAATACERLNMRLAEITTREEANVIKSYSDSGMIAKNWFWVGGRDAFEPRQFSWASSQQDVSRSDINIAEYPSIPYTCLALKTDEATLYPGPCRENHHQRRLCEIPPPSQK